MGFNRPLVTILALLGLAALAWLLRTHGAEPDEPDEPRGAESTDREGDPGRDGAAPGEPGDGSAEDPAPDVPSPRPTPLATLGGPWADPALVPGKPGVPPPPGLPIPPDARATDPPDDPDAHRSEDRAPPPPMGPADVHEHPHGKPPTPQGAGVLAHEVATGEPDPFEPVADPEAVLGQLEAAVRVALAEASNCFGGHAPPAMRVTVRELRGDGARSGYVSVVDPVEGAWSDATEDCVMLLLDELSLAAPPGARTAVLELGAP